MSTQIELPNWAQEFSRKYRGRTLTTFNLHGNVRDYVGHKLPDGKSNYTSISTFLDTVLFAQRDMVIHFDMAQGMTFATPEMRAEFMRITAMIDSVRGTDYAKGLPRDVVLALDLFWAYIKTRLLAGKPEQKRIALVIDRADIVFPNSDPGYASTADRSALVSLLQIASNPEVIANDITIVLLCENIALLNIEIRRTPFGTAIHIPLPNDVERREYLLRLNAQEELDYTSEVLAKICKHTAGLSRVQMRTILAEARTIGADISDGRFVGQRKREIVQQECSGLLEFVEPRYDLSLVAVHHRAVAMLKCDADLIRKGFLDAVPMGYLITGPFGCGKTFTIMAFAGEVGMPCVIMKNFRDKWQGSTEANLEKIIRLLEGLAPVFVIIDEADAALGDRDNEGDSGVSNRVFSTLVSFMGNTDNRGKIIWCLLTNRPDLLTVDVKRQGRCEQHIPLFLPQSVADYEDLFSVLKKKLKINISVDKLCEVADMVKLNFSGADLEAVLIRAKGAALLNGKDTIDKDTLKAAIDDFIPPAYPLEIEYQTLVAIAESTSRALIPEKLLRDQTALAMRIAELKVYM